MRELGPGPQPPSATFVDQANQTRASDAESEEARFLDLDSNGCSSPDADSGNVIFYVDGLPYDIDPRTDFNQAVQYNRLSVAEDDCPHDPGRQALIPEHVFTSSPYPMSPEPIVARGTYRMERDETMETYPSETEYGSASPPPYDYKEEHYLPCRYMNMGGSNLPAQVYNRNIRGSTDSECSITSKVSKRKSRKVTTKTRKRKTQKSLQLWQFLRMILADDRYNPHFIIWVSEEEGIFKFVQSKKVAQIWGQRKERPRMPYEHLSRAMRHYYKRGILRRIESRRLTYQFLPNAAGWREGFTDRDREVPKKNSKS